MRFYAAFVLAALLAACGGSDPSAPSDPSESSDRSDRSDRSCLSSQVRAPIITFGVARVKGPALGSPQAPAASTRASPASPRPASPARRSPTWCGSRGRARTDGRPRSVGRGC